MRNTRTAEAITQRSSLQEPIVIEKADDEEAAAICQPSPPVEHEEHEEKEVTMNGKIEQYELPARNSIKESIDVHDVPESEPSANVPVHVPVPVPVPVPERPTTLTLGKPEITKMDMMSLLSPDIVSPMSKQVKRYDAP